MEQERVRRAGDRSEESGARVVKNVREGEKKRGQQRGREGAEDLKRRGVKEIRDL